MQLKADFCFKTFITGYHEMFTQIKVTIGENGQKITNLMVIQGGVGVGIGYYPNALYSSMFRILMLKLKRASDVYRIHCIQ